MASRVDVAIIGAGPAGMFLAHLLQQRGRRVIVLEVNSRDYVEGRVRAGVLEHGTVELMTKLGVGDRVRSEGLIHEGVNLAVDGEILRIDLARHTGHGITVYGQQAVMHDLFEAAERDGINVVFEAHDASITGVDQRAPTVTWRRNGRVESVTCDFVAGCDGSHGPSRQVMSNAVAQTFTADYPFGWLGILVDVPPAATELIYARHDRGFALASMRSATRSRYYVQCSIEDSLEDWPDERAWEEICLRLGDTVSQQVTRGPSFEKSIAPLRSVVTEPMQHGRLFVAGDAAHLVPPTGAKGLNLAVADVLFLARAIDDYYATGMEDGLLQYSKHALARVWKAQRFSWWLTRLTHRFADDTPYQRRLQRTEFDYLRTSSVQQRVFAENYVGLPFEPG